MSSSRPTYLIFLIISLFLLIEFVSLDRIGAGYDEIDDLNIAKSYQTMPLTGSAWDPTQARLPMYAVHLFAQLAGYTLRAARFITILFAALGLYATYLCAKKLGGAKAGILACFLLAINPLYLEFAKHACTESGAIEASLSIVVCYFVIRLDHLKTSDLVRIGIISGLLISAKFTGIIQIPLGLTAVLWLDRKEIFTGTIPRKSLPVWLALILPACVLLFYFVQIPGVSSLMITGARIEAAPLLLFSASAYCAALLILSAYRNSNFSLWVSLYLVFVLCIATTLLIPPPHFCNLDIFSSFVQRIINSYSVPPWPHKMEYLGLCFLFKQSPFLGFMFVLTTIGAVWLARRNLRLFVPLVSMGLWIIAIKKTEMMQVFYLLPLLPCASVIAAVVLCTISKKRPIMTYGLASFCLIGTMADLFTSYPDFNLVPYKYFKKAIIIEGYPPIGCSMMTDVGFDGMAQCLKYVNDRAKGTEIVVSYFRYEADHIYRHAMPEKKIILINGNRADNRNAYKTADFVISTLEVETLHELEKTHEDLRDESMFFYDQAELEKRFTRVFTVDRAYGLTIASVWKRKL